MKTIFTFLVINFIFLTSFAQTSKQIFQSDCNPLMYNSIIDVSEVQNCKIGFIHNPFSHSNRQDIWLDPNFELKQSLDSIVLEDYNSDIDDWIKYDVMEYTYNAHGFNTQSISYDMNEDETKLIPYYKYNHFFDSDGNVASINYFKWDESAAEWGYYFRREYTYDISNRLTEYIMYFRNESNTDWTPLHKSEYVYDFSGELIEGRSYGWDDLNNEWNLSVKDEWTYDESGYIKQRISHIWAMSEEWVKHFRSDYLTDSNGNIIEITGYRGNYETDEWVHDYKENLEYNLNGYMTNRNTNYWNDSTNQWINDLSWDFAYDVHGNPFQTIYYDWDTLTNDWSSDGKAEYTYNLAYSADELLMPASWPEFFPLVISYPHYINMPVGLTYYIYEDNMWKIDDREKYYYSEMDISAVSDLSVSDIIIFPNPAKDFIRIEGFASPEPILVKVFDIQGKILISQDMSGNKQLDISELKYGLYVCQITINRKTFTKKLIIE